MIRTALLLVLLTCIGCSTRSGVYGYYQYPAGITKQCHLKIDRQTVSVMSLEENRLFWSHPYEREDGKIIVTQTKERLELTPGNMIVTDQKNRVYSRVPNGDRLNRLKKIQ